MRRQRTRMRASFRTLSASIVLLIATTVFASESNSTVHRVDIVITVAGVKETVASIQQSTEQLVQLTKRLSTKSELTSKDQALITGLTQALNRNADAINEMTNALPAQFEAAQGGLDDLLNSAAANAEEVVRSSKSEVIDPTLSRIENRILIFVAVVTIILFGLLAYVFWKVRLIVSTGSETVANIMNTVTSLEKVLEKAVVAENHDKTTGPR